jgi:hypothetical protein
MSSRWRFSLAWIVTCAWILTRPLVARSDDYDCPQQLRGTGKEETARLPKSECFGVVLVCYYCKYDPSGQLKDRSPRPCGACVGLSF